MLIRKSVAELLKINLKILHVVHCRHHHCI